MALPFNLVKRVGPTIVKHRARILDVGFLLVLLAAAALFAFEFDVFRDENVVSLQQRTVELDELLVLTILVVLGVLAYTWRRAAQHKRETERRLAAESEILRLALQDPLTGLPNRRQFDAALTSALQALPAAPEGHAVLMLDLNGFKRINDLHGHPVGDEVLIHVGSRLLRAVRDGDLVARLGGDEFAILARHVAGPEAVTTVAQRIIEGLRAPITAGGVQHPVGTAIGIAMAPQDDNSADEIVRKADVALYRAKAERASALRFFEPEMDARLAERAKLETALRQALADEAITLRFKPTTDIRTGAVTAFEATPHWIDPALGEIAADRLFAVAQDIGVISELTTQLFRKACAEAAAWPPAVRLAFPVTAAQLRATTFGVHLLGTLGASGLSPTRLDLEIDEGALIRDTEGVRPILEPLRAAGISVVASHFGTGYSDLQNLHRLRLDRIKIDPSFVAAMLHDRQAATMVKALIGVGKSMDIAVAADGVGSLELQSALAREGCQEIQGGSAAAPLDADEARSLAAASDAPTKAPGRASRPPRRSPRSV